MSADGAAAPETLWELLLRLVDARHNIYVRAKLEGGWQSVAIADLPDGEAAAHVLQWLDSRWPEAAALLGWETE